MAAVRSRVFRGPPRHTDARCVRKPIFADSADSDSDVRDLSPLDSQHDAATPLHHAAEEGDVSLIRALLKIGARVDERDAEGQTPLMAAASWGEPEAIRALVEGGADTSAQDDGGDTALHEAARADEVESLMMLLELGAEKDPGTSSAPRPASGVAQGKQRGDEGFDPRRRRGARRQVVDARRVLAAARGGGERVRGLPAGPHRRRLEPAPLRDESSLRGDRPPRSSRRGRRAGTCRVVASKRLGQRVPRSTVCGESRRTTREARPADDHSYHHSRTPDGLTTSVGRRPVRIISCNIIAAIFKTCFLDCHGVDVLKQSFCSPDPYPLARRRAQSPSQSGSPAT